MPRREFANDERRDRGRIRERLAEVLDQLRMTSSIESGRTTISWCSVLYFFATMRA